MIHIIIVLSIIPGFSRIQEELIANRLFAYVWKQNILYLFLFGLQVVEI